MALFSLTACTGRDGISSVGAHLHVNTLAEAQAIAASFPKSLRVKASTCSGMMDSLPAGVTAPERVSTDWNGAYWGYVSFSVDLSADDNNKGVNEAGRKRIKWFLQLAETSYKADAFGNSATLEQWAAFVEAL